MKKFRFFTAVIAVLTLITVLASCAGGISTSDTKAIAVEFTQKLIDKDYEGAYAMYAPGKAESSESVKNYVAACEEAGVYFKGEITDVQTVNVKTSYYNSQYNGSVCELTLKFKMDGTEYKLKITVTKSGENNVIYSYDIKTPD